MKLTEEQKKLLYSELDYKKMWEELEKWFKTGNLPVFPSTCLYKMGKAIDQQIDELFKPLPNFGDHFTWKEFEDHVKNGMFMDYDGTGYYALKDKEVRIRVDIYDFKEGTSPYKDIFTHVMWYNK